MSILVPATACQQILSASREDFPGGIRVYHCTHAKVAAVISGTEEDAGMLALLCWECKKGPGLP